MTEHTRQRLEHLGELAKLARRFSMQMIDPPPEKSAWGKMAAACEEAAETIALIEELREDEGDSVLIASDNADFNGLPNCLITCFGNWTAWADVDFTGGTILACLKSAVSRRREVESDETRKEPGDSQQ